uniref:Cystatin domain-containing protein n=1 Tax=Elaeophora elaphi TaxID=1147741 RepID=A0A0R3RQN0_9BILA
MSWRAAAEMNRASNDAYHWVPVKVLRITSQVVAGIKYVLDVLMAQSNCTKNVSKFYIAFLASQR